MKTAQIFQKLCLTFFLIAICSFLTFGQKRIDTLAKFHDTASFVVVKFKEGSTYFGKLKENKNDTLTLIMEDLGSVKIPYDRIKKVETVEYMVMKKGKYWFPTPLPGRYLFAPSAFTLNPGEGYYQNTMLALNSVNVGVTKWFSIGGGLEFFSTIGSITAGEFKPTFYVSPKVGFKIAENLRAGCGVIYAQFLGNDFQAGILYGVVTYGNPDYNATAGVGWGFSKTNSSSFTFGKNPMITVCGTARVARKIALVTENWIITYKDNSMLTCYPVYSYGVRFFGETVSFDLAFINNKDISGILFIGIPFLSCTVKF
ncbi:MAG: hypothetical protein NTX61_16730 [Bacteroidetes bacterium]|nr:hypothetical protein [Bacteroidota bacterium]